MVAQQLKHNAEKHQVEIDESRGRIARAGDEHRLIWQFRKNLIIACGGVVGVYLFAVLLIVCGQGVGCINLKDSVLIALMGSTTVNVMGLLAVVLKFVFPPPGRHPDDRTK